VPHEFAADYERVAREQGIEIEWGILPTTKNIFTYTVPINFTWIVTLVSLRSIPAPGDVSLTPGDWRSTELDASGTAKGRWKVFSRPETQESSTYFCPVNRPCLFAFEGAAQVKLEIEREPIAVPATQQFVTAVNSYLAPPEALDNLAPYLSQIESSFT
jgi:hypothetical protein